MEKSLYLFNVNEKILSGIAGIDFNSLFLGYQKISEENVSRIKNINTNVRLYAEVPIFEGKDLLEKFPDAKAVEYRESPSEKDQHVGVCPTHAGVRDEIMRRVNEALTQDIDGIWLNFIRYPTKWEGDKPVIMDTCYCERCLQKFGEFIGEPIKGKNLEEKYLLIDGSYYYEWLEFKTDQIASMVKSVKESIEKSGKNIKLGMFLVPWKDDEYGQAIKRIVAQDFSKLFKIVDIFSPMLYHKTVCKPVEWIRDMVDYYWETGKEFFPLIQTEDKPDKIKDDEFKKSLEYASKSPSQGVCAFFADDLVEKPSKMKILKGFFSAG